MVSAAVRAMQRSNPYFWERSFNFDDDIIFGKHTPITPEQGMRRPYSVKRKPVPAPVSGVSPLSNPSSPILTQSQHGAMLCDACVSPPSSVKEVPVLNNTLPEQDESLEELIHSALAYEGQFYNEWPQPTIEPSFTPPPIAELPAPAPAPRLRMQLPMHTYPAAKPKLAPLQTNLNRHSRPPTLVQTQAFDNIAPQLIHPDEDEDTSSESEISCRTPSKNSIDLEDPLTAKIDSAIEELSRFQPLTRMEAIEVVKEEHFSPHPSVANSIAMLRFMMQDEY